MTEQEVKQELRKLIPGRKRRTPFEELRAYIDAEFNGVWCELQLHRHEGAAFNAEYALGYVTALRKLLNAAEYIYTHGVQPPH